MDFALAALTFVGVMNMIGVRWLGEVEFWFSVVKVAALVLFLIIGVVFLLSGDQVAGHDTGSHLIAENGGMFSHGFLPAIVIVQGVVFAYAGIELIGTAAGEAQNAKEILPRAINSVMYRIALFYVGSVVLLVLLMPWTAYKAGTSPFVTFFGALGVQGIGTVMNVVVLTAALSSLNSGLDSTGRVLRSLAMGGSAPPFVARMNAQKVPYGGIVVTLVIYLAGVLLNYVVPSQVFEVVLNIASLGIVSTWGFIVVCQMVLRRAINRGDVAPVSFRMPFAPFTSWLTLAFLLGVLVLMVFNYPDGTYTIAAIPLVAVLARAGLEGIERRQPDEPDHSVLRVDPDGRRARGSPKLRDRHSPGSNGRSRQDESMTGVSFMRRAIALSCESVASRQGGPFGAVIVQDGLIVAEGSNCVTSANDPTAHAEIVGYPPRLRWARPVSSCTGARFTPVASPARCAWLQSTGHGSDRVFYGNDRAAAAAIGFDDEALYREVALPILQRSLPTSRMLANEAARAFTAWNAKADKVEY